MINRRNDIATQTSQKQIKEPSEPISGVLSKDPYKTTMKSQYVSTTSLQKAAEAKKDLDKEKRDELLAYVKQGKH